MKKVLILLIPFILSGCSMGQPTAESETEKLEEYLNNSSLWKQDQYGMFYNDVTGSHESFPDTNKEYFYKQLDTNTLIFTYVNNSISDDGNYNYLNYFTYDFKTNVASGSSSVTYNNNYIAEGFPYVVTTKYYYDYTNGTTECTKKDLLGMNEMCNISAEISGTTFLSVKKQLMTILEDSEVDTSVLK